MISDLEKEVNKIVLSNEFRDYCDNELNGFAVSYVDYIFNEYDSKNRLSLTQARGILNISYSLITNYDELKRLCDNRLKKNTNENTKAIWEQLFHLFDSSKNNWKQYTKLDKMTPKEFVEQQIIEGLTDKNKKEFIKLLYANLMQNFCIHFYSHYNYINTLKGGR